MFYDADIDLISLVQARPVLWNKAVGLNICKHQVFRAWQEVFTQLNDEYEGLDNKKKNDYGKGILKKWRNIMDAYRKSRAETKDCEKSGGTAKPGKSFIYESQLQFLDQVLERNDDAGNWVENNEAGLITEENTANNEAGLITEENTANNEAGLITEENTANNEAGLITEENSANSEVQPENQLDPVEQEVVRRRQYRHMAFFKSILPSLKDFDDLEVIEFYSGTLQFVQKIREHRDSEK